jgi:hypothetical protein
MLPDQWRATGRHGVDTKRHHRAAKRQRDRDHATTLASANLGSARAPWPAAARPISTAVTEGTVQWLLHRRMNAQQHKRWSPRGAHLMLKVRTATANGTLERDHAVAERWARRPFRRAA